MPNVKLFTDRQLVEDLGQSLLDMLPLLRDLLCDRLGVTASACQIVIVPVYGLQDQPPVNLELHILPRADRTPDRIRSICLDIKTMVDQTTQKPSAIRCAMLDPSTYVAIK